MPNLAPPPAIQVRPAPGPFVPPQAPAPAASPKRPAGLSNLEQELLAGVLAGIAGAVALFFISGHLQQENMVDTIFNALFFGLILWLTGLLVGLASPHGRAGHIPWLALLVTLLTVVVGLPLAQAIGGNGGISNLETLLRVLIASPFLFLGAVGIWVGTKLIGR